MNNRRNFLKNIGGCAVIPFIPFASFLNTPRQTPETLQIWGNRFTQQQIIKSFLDAFIKKFDDDIKYGRCEYLKRQISSIYVVHELKPRKRCQCIAAKIEFRNINCDHPFPMVEIAHAVDIPNDIVKQYNINFEHMVIKIRKTLPIIVSKRFRSWICIM